MGMGTNPSPYFLILSVITHHFRVINMYHITVTCGEIMTQCIAAHGLTAALGQGGGRREKGGGETAAARAMRTSS